MNLKPIIATFALSLLMAVPTACSHRQSVAMADEEATYLLVGEPCSEGDYATAIHRADSLLSAPINMSDTLRAYIMIDRDVSLLEQGTLDWGYAYADTVIDFGRKTGIALAEMQGLQNQGIVCRRKGDWDKAITLYKEGMDIAVSEDDEEMQQIFAELLSVACAEHGLYEEAISFAEKSMQMARNMNDSMQELNVASTIGGILTKQGKYAKALDYLRPYMGQFGSVRGVLRVKCLTPVLKSYIALDSIQKVKETLGELYSALEGMPTKSQAYLVAVNAEALLAEKEGRFADQWRWLQTADSIGGMGSDPAALYDVRARCLANLQKYKDAYEMQTRAYLAADSARSAENDARLSELTVKYDTLQKDKAISELKAQRLSWGIATLSVILVLMMVVAIVVFINIRNRRRLERERREEYIRGLEHERRRIARELHDDIAGSLVGLQFKLRVADPAQMEKELVSLNRRVRTMSHEMMPPDFSRRSFIDILGDFVERFGGDDAIMPIRLSREGSFDWNSLSPEDSHELYRIVQESVSNSIRHGGEGEILVSLCGDVAWCLSVGNVVGHTVADSADSTGIGSRTLRDRAAIIGASLATEEKDGKYTITLMKII